MNISRSDDIVTITNPLKKLEVSGSDNNITIQSYIEYIDITGSDNKIEGLFQNHLINNINVKKYYIKLFYILI